ncbi:hypothetical protein [Pediococcus stilesii]|uniref:Oligosaccharide repeat unit polymerase Wzy n=1 Tax=Pediococcus stilesii TaxID=331679 RepID=A0A0R2KYX7_9LACO|nr:hypothetical protein [Pediococcus stilesii]KRN94729.1 oligosaccharide repeat unit polymerase Wzy [Pediococcus stilesii]
MDLNEKKESTLSNLLFLVAYTIVIFISSLTTTLYAHIIPAPYVSSILIVGISILFCKFIFTDKHSFFEYTLYLFIGIILLISMIKSESKQLIVVAIFMLMSKNVKSRPLLKIYLIVSLLVLLFSYFSTKMGWIMDLTYTRNMIERHSYGIVYPTDFASHIFYVCCAYVFLRFKKFNLFDVIFLLVTALLVYRQTDARLNFGMILLLIVVGLLGKKEKLDFLNTVAWLVPIFSFLFTYLASRFYNPTSFIFDLLNKLFSGRLGIVQEILNESGVKFWGQKIIEHGWGGSGFYLNTNIYEYSYIDSAFMRLLIIYGLMACLLFLLIIIFFLYKSKNSRTILIVILILLSGIVEQHFIDIAYNPFFILLASEYFNKKGLLQACKNI